MGALLAVSKIKNFIKYLSTSLEAKITQMLLSEELDFTNYTYREIGGVNLKCAL